MVDGIPVGEELRQCFIADMADDGLANQEMSLLFQATVEASEEAILNALFTANIVEGHRGTIEATNIDEIRSIIGSYRYDDTKNKSDD